jgi:hypothetical protein
VHGNGGFVRGGAADELDGAAALSVAATPRLTASAELLIRRLDDLHPIAAASFPHPSLADVQTLRLVPGAGGSTLASAITGVKWNPYATIVITGQLRWRLSNAGLTAPVTPTIAIDYLF